MKNTKKKVLALSLAVCLLAILSFGTLAWFNDYAEVTNQFRVATSEDTGDNVFKVTVDEKGKPGDEWSDEGLEYDNLAPGDDLTKVVRVSNTGAYDEWVRVNFTLSDYGVWQKIFAKTGSEGTFAKFVVIDLLGLETDLLEKNEDGSVKMIETVAGDSVTYTVYLKDELLPGTNVKVMKQVSIPTQFDQNDLVDENGKVLGDDGFTIKVVADAVQTKNLEVTSASAAFAKVNWAVGAVNPAA